MSTPYHVDDDITLHVGDCREVLAEMADASVDAICCDPPYELGFMGRSWDTSGIAFDPIVWRECLRVLKPGGHLVAFGGTRTYHRMAAAIEDAGFEIRDSMHWIYGSGFPKSMDLSKAIDKTAGHWRGRAGEAASPNGSMSGANYERTDKGEPVTAAAAAWHGWGTALKPSHEPMVLARKPFTGTVIETVLGHGTGALNIAACRVEPTGESCPRVGEVSQERRYTDRGGTDFAPLPGVRGGAPEGRWPTNLVFTHSALCVEGGPCEPDCPVAELDRQSGQRANGKMRAGTVRANRDGWAGPMPATTSTETYGDVGGASRYFPTFRFEAKAPTRERPKLADGTAHATVKPLDLMRWLVRLITPPGGTVLDPFAGSGTTGEACLIEGFRPILIELEQPHAELIKRRLAKNIQPVLFGDVSGWGTDA
ncbi:MAG TPA: site-specific DNA-methyltransferase [Sporichthya sp.]|nr:site-specific DNA-methyltransferase [Sporichthya sp.]